MPNNLNTLLTSTRRGKTIEIRTELMFQGLIQQGHTAQAAGAEAYGIWQKDVSAAIPEYCSAVSNLPSAPILLETMILGFLAQGLIAQQGGGQPYNEFEQRFTTALPQYCAAIAAAAGIATTGGKPMQAGAGRTRE